MKYSKQPSSIVSVWSCLREFLFIDNLNWSIWLNDFLFWGNFLPKLNLLFSFTSLDLGPSYLKIYYMRRFVRFSTILYNLKNLKNIHGWVLLLVKFQVSTAKGSYDFMVSHMSCLVANVVVGVELYIYFATWPHKNVIQRSCDFMSVSSSLHVTTLLSLVAIGIVVVEIYCFLFLICHVILQDHATKRYSHSHSYS